MTYRGYVKNGQITLDDPVQLPEGAEVAIQLLDRSGDGGNELSELLLRHAGKGCDLPADLAERHDHYVHGKPRP